MMKVRNKLLFSFLSIALLLIVFSDFILLSGAENAIISRTNSQLDSTLLLKQSLVETFVSKNVMQLDHLSIRYCIRDYIFSKENESASPDEVERFRVRTLDAFREIMIESEYLEISLLDVNGIVTVSTNSTLEGNWYGNETFFKEGLEGEYIERIGTEAIQTGYFVTAEPIVEKGRNLGVITGKIDTKPVNQIFGQTTGLGFTGETFMADAEGHAITDLGENNASKTINLSKEITKECITGQNGSKTVIDKDGKRIRANYVWLPEEGVCIIAKIDEEEALAQLNPLKTDLLASSTAVFLLGAAMIWVVSRRMTKPLTDLRRSTEAIRKGIYDFEIDTSQKDEIGDLARSFKEMQQEINRKRVELDQMIEFLPDATFVIDKEGKVIAWNKAMEEMTGVKKQNIIGRGNHEYSMPFYGERRPILIDLVDVPEKELETRYKNVRKEGDTLYAEAYVPKTYNGKGAFLWGVSAPFFDGEGKRIGSIESIRDITAERTAEKELQGKTSELNQMIEFLPDATFVIDKEGKVIAWNKAMEEMTGVHKEQMIGKGDKEYAIPFYGERTQMMIDFLDKHWEGSEKGYTNIKKIGDTIYAESFAQRLDNGKGKHLWIKASKIFDEKGEYFGAMESIRDVTDWKRAEERLKESEGQFRSIAETSTDIIFRVGLDGRINYVSPSIEKMVGYTIGETLNKNFIDFLAPEEQEKTVKEFRELVEKDVGDTSQLFDSKIIKKDGDMIYAEVNAIVLKKNGQPREIQGSIHDVTKRKRAEDLVEKILECSAIPSCVIDKNHNISHWNKAMEALSGTCKQDALGKDIQWTIFYNEKRPILSDLLLDGAKEEDIREIYGEDCTKSTLVEGGYEGVGFFPKLGDRWVLFTAAPIKDSLGSTMGVLETVQDITKKKEAESKLAEHLAFMEILLDTIPNPVFFKDTEGRYMGCNKAFESYLGKKKTEIIGKGSHDVAPRKLAEKNEEKDKELFQKPGTQIYESEVRYADGTNHNVIFNKAAFNRPDGTLGGLVGVILDITEIRSWEKAMKESEEKYRKLVETIQEGIWVVDRESITTFVNPRMAEMLGYTTEEMIGKHFFSFMDERGIEKAQESFDQKKREVSDRYDFALVRKDGKQIYVSMETSPIKDERGEYTGVIAGVQDLTERMEKDMELRSAYVKLNEELKYEEIISRITSTYMKLENFHENTQKTLRLLGETLNFDNVALFRDDGTEVKTEFEWIREGKPNARKEELPAGLLNQFREASSEKGYTTSDEIKEKVPELRKALEEQGVKTGICFSLTVRNEFYGLLALDSFSEEKSIADSEKALLKTIVGIISNALERRLSEEELMKRNEELEHSKVETLDVLRNLRLAMEKQKKLEKVKTEFLSVTSHELRTPITPMKAQLQMVLGEYFGKLSDEQKKSLDIVLRNTVRLDHLIGDILDISKLESGNMKFLMKKSDLNEVVKTAVDTLKSNADAKEITLDAKLERIPEMTFDRDRITQVVMNLVNNAIKFTDRGGRITVRTVNDMNQALVKVTDSGIGISEEDQKSLFTPFVQVDSSVSRNHEGTGLGLAICKGIVKNHGGELGIDSREGKGATFWFSLPYVPFIKREREEVELFAFNKAGIAKQLREKLEKQGYDIVEDRLQALLESDLVNDEGKLRYNISPTDLEKEGYIKKK